MVTFDNLKLGISIAARYCGLALLRTQNDGSQGVRYNEN